MNFALASPEHLWNDAVMVSFFAIALAVPSAPVFAHYQAAKVRQWTEVSTITSAVAPRVPFYSQFRDITSASWKKVGCGIASLAMVIDYYKPAVSVDTLLQQGIDSGAYLQNAGWTYKGLIGVAKKYSLNGNSYDLAPLDSKAAFTELKRYLKDGPVIVSVHYKFDPKSTIPHLVVINGIVGDVLYYNDPAAPTGNRQISSSDFLKAWKKRFIVIRPSTDGAAIALAESNQIRR